MVGRAQWCVGYPGQCVYGSIQGLYLYFSDHAGRYTVDHAGGVHDVSAAVPRGDTGLNVFTRLECELRHNLAKYLRNVIKTVVNSIFNGSQNTRH